MSSILRPKEGGNTEPPHIPTKQTLPLWIPVALVVLILGLAGVAYTQYSGKSELEQRVADLESKIDKDLKKLEASDTAMASDIDVVTKKIGVNVQDLAQARAFAEKLRKEHEQSLEEQKQLASALEKKADSSAVEANVAAARAEAASKVAEAQKDSDTKISSVSGDVKTVATNLEATRADLAASKRDLVDVKTTLSDQIARNASELATLRQKGEKDFFEFTLNKAKKNEMQRVGDVRLALNDADPKKGRYAIVIQVDDSNLVKKDKIVNEPVQFLVGKDQLRYEIVVNKIEKDKVVGYLSTPKNKVLSAERPALK